MSGQDDLTRWSPQKIHGDHTCEVRVHSDGYVVWHRRGCQLGGKIGSLTVSVATDVPYSAFLAAFEREQNRDGGTSLFCSGCLVYEPTPFRQSSDADTAPSAAARDSWGHSARHPLAPSSADAATATR